MEKSQQPAYRIEEEWMGESEAVSFEQRLPQASDNWITHLYLLLQKRKKTAL